MFQYLALLRMQKLTLHLDVGSKVRCIISTLPLHPFVVLSHPFSNCRAVLIVKNI